MEGARRTIPTLALLAMLGACEDARTRVPPAACVPGEGVVCSRIHPEGILDTRSPDHHAALLRSTRYDFAACADCHGRDFAGGTSGASCRTCHEGGPTACTTCHAELPRQGAHAVHLGPATVEQPEACAECHEVPATWDVLGHARLPGGALDPRPAEVRLGALASRGASAERPPTYDPATRTCSNVTCHGGLIPDTGAADPSPRWDAPHQELGCSRCHGAPPTTPYHAIDTCESCHPRVASGGGLVDRALHVDTRIDLGPDGSGSCAGCHPGIPAEPMHRAHLEPALRLGGALTCQGCHVTPRTATAAGHLDSPPPVEVFPPGHSSAAWAGGATPTWDAAERTCAGTWCHGVGTTVRWQRFPSQLVCGSCHGIPPATAAHQPEWTVRECARCHDSVDGFGNPLLVDTSTGVASRHLDGKVDLR